MNKVTIMDIARAAGVSKATVSMILNNKDENLSPETRDRVNSIARELNYIPNSIARSLSTRKSKTIGIILPDIINPFFSEMARAIEDAANDFGYNVIFCNSDNLVEKEEKYVKLLISKLVDGVIFMSGGKSIENIEVLKSNNIPFVLVDRYIEGYRDCHGVFCSNTNGMKKCFEYLYGLGKRRIAFVKGPEDLVVSNRRLKGYVEASKERGIYDESLIFPSDFTIRGGMEATERIIRELKGFDAIMYSNDVMAFGGIKVLYRNGYSVPEDVSITGFDNIQFSEFIEPELTTIAQPIYEMGREACRLLVNVIEGNQIEKKMVYFEAELKVRGTTK